MTRKVKVLLKDKNTAFSFGDVKQECVTKAKLKQGLREAKIVYKNKIEDHLRNNNSRQVRQWVQHITNDKPMNTAVDRDASLAEELNCKHKSDFSS